MLQKLYQKVLEYSAHPKAVFALMALSFTEASFFPIPPDVALVTMGLAKPKKSFIYAAIAVFFSVLGGIAGYFIGLYLWDIVSPFFFNYLFSPEKFEKVRELYEGNAFSAIFVSGYTPIPYKIFTISAGAFKISLKTFIFASILGRSLRFFLIGSLIYFFGEKAKVWVEKHLQKIIFISSALILIVLVLFKLLF